MTTANLFGVRHARSVRVPFASGRVMNQRIDQMFNGKYARFIRIGLTACVSLLVLLSAPRLYSCEEPSLVDRLATTNSVWTIQGASGKEKATRGEIFDPKESERIRMQIKELLKKNEENWYELVSHLNDDRHSGIGGIDGGYPRNWTVSDVCHHIIGDTLSSPFYKHFPGTKTNHQRFKMPSFARDKEKLAKWCLERKARKLYELQIEACEWAIKELDSGDISERDIDGAKKTELVSQIRNEIEDLRKSKTAVPCTSTYSIR